MRRNNEVMVNSRRSECLAVTRMVAIGGIGLSSMLMTGAVSAETPAESAVSISGEQIVVGGTNDPYAANMPNLGGSLQEASPAAAVPYVAEAGPIVGAQTYNISVEQAAGGITERLQNNDEQYQTITGFSQGSDAAGRASADAYAAGELDDHRTKLILVGDPMNPGTPGGLRGISYSLPFIPGFESMHARGDTGVTEIVEPCLQYDPICRFNPGDPVNMALGYIAHTGQGPFTNYNTVDTSDAIVETYGNVTSVTYLTPTPVEELLAANAVQSTPASAAVTTEQAAPALSDYTSPAESAANWVDTTVESTSVAIDSYVASAQAVVPDMTPQITQVAIQAHEAVANVQQQANQFLAQFAPR